MAPYYCYTLAYADLQAKEREQINTHIWFWFLVLLCRHTASNPITVEMQQVVRSNEEARKRLTESNGTPAMDLGHMNVLFVLSSVIFMFCCMIVVLK